MNRAIKLAATSILSIAVAASGAISAHANQFRTEYTIAALGLKVGSSSFRTVVSGGNYTVEGSLTAAGIARLFTDTSGSLTVKGSIKGGDINASAFDVRYKEGNASKRTTISFSGNRVTGAKNRPEPKKGKKWVEVSDSHLRGALDPISAIMVPASSLRNVCSQTLKVFDGSMRADFPMSYLRMVPFSATGYKGDAVTCRARFKPISGYDADKPDVIWMRDNGYVDISFAPVGDTGLYAPVSAKIKTRAATISIRATRFERLTN